MSRSCSSATTPRRSRPPAPCGSRARRATIPRSPRSRASARRPPRALNRHGVASVAELAALDNAALARLAEHIDIVGDPHAALIAWRDEGGRCLTPRYRVAPRARAPVAAFGRVWPAEGAEVTTREVDVRTLQRLEDDPRFAVERLDAPEEPRKPSRRARG